MEKLWSHLFLSPLWGHKQEEEILFKNIISGQKPYFATDTVLEYILIIFR